MSRKASASFRRDFYKILNVSTRATTEEIKTAYRKMALMLHPDRHDGDSAKTRAFKEASEAYNILIDNERRRQYDMAHGYSPSGWYNRNRRRPPPANYRKVYAPHAPPDGKWHDAQRHYDMHYGDGMFQEAVKGAYDRAKKAGEFDYHSPLGKGFKFEKTPFGGGANNPYFKNPYSKADQGPPSQQYQYEEGYIDEAKTVLKRKSGVINKLHERRLERYEREEQRKAEVMNAAPNNGSLPTNRIYEPLNQQQQGGCSVM